ncbi:MULTISPECIES: tyrosine-protein phosphatase [Aestuariibaculum]|uniref:Tyrosine-protein phosphatase n=1 Tax=Aestuariibaculum lutulentum TaxID=2920935 RepID=A0ABS9RIS4_9FLAO|nr:MULTISPECIES: tyrosine-protein phosphatase [Aestuariibaculum]MCH4552861.1 tyrosine-protein phosphatase [Aestuariibaculum lutulentum]MCR8669249.1 tyrosine-protein phosphatase [Aestuariibaculum sp. M13]
MINKKHIKGLLSVASIAVFAACAEYTKPERPEYTLNEVIYVDKLPEKDYQLTLRSKGNWNVYSGNSFETINWKAPVTLSNENKIITIKNSTPNQRLAFAAVNGKDTLHLTEREIDLENSVNFRDLGGIPTQDGKHTKWGLIYRSGELSDLTNEDLAYMSTIDIKSILDFRTNEEIEEKPDMYPNGVQWFHVPVGNMGNGNMKEMFGKLREANPETFDGGKLMEDISEDLLKSKDAFKTLFSDLLNNDRTPLLFHCTAGKDRTGHASALILTALGVDEETIYNEYTLSNYFRYDNNEETIKKAAKFYGIDQRILRPMMSVRRSYLQTGMDILKAEYGSVQNYLETEIGLDSTAISKLRNKFLE